MEAERPAFWFAPIWAAAAGEIDRTWLSRLQGDPEGAARVLVDDEFAAERHAFYRNLPDEEHDFGLVDIGDIPSRHPGGVALEAADLDQARIEAAALWEAGGFRDSDGRLPGGYMIPDTESFVLAHRHVRAERARQQETGTGFGAEL
jgi:hypothetical protein